MNTKIKKPVEENRINDLFTREINSLTTLIDSYPFEEKKAYGYYLNQQYFLIRYTTRLIALSASMVDTNEPQEFRWWADHLQEEMDHDQLILSDMSAIGYDYNDACEPIIRGLSLALFEDIRRHGQDAILGYALMLEGLSLERGVIISDRIKKFYRTGYSYLDVHAVADEKHFPEGMRRLETFSAERKKVIIENLHMSASLYRSFLSILNKSQHHKA